MSRSRLTKPRLSSSTPAPSPRQRIRGRARPSVASLAPIPSARLVVTGCYASRAPEELASLPNVAHVVPNTRKETLFEVLGAASPVNRPSASTAVTGRAGPRLRLEWPVARRSRCACRRDATNAAATASSRQPVAEAGRSPLTKCCRTSVALLPPVTRRSRITGVHLGSYGRDLPERSSLAALLRRLAEWPADVLFRVSSLEPMDCTSRGGVAGRLLATNRAALPSAVAARRRFHAPRHAPAIHRDVLLGAR